LFGIFLLFQHLHEKKKGGNTYDTIDTMRGWLLYTVIAIMLAVASFFFGLAGFIGFWVAWVVLLVLIQASKK
jgi:hypothetical protein